MKLRERLAALGVGQPSAAVTDAGPGPHEVAQRVGFRERLARHARESSVGPAPQVRLRDLPGAEVLGDGAEAFLRIDRPLDDRETRAALGDWQALWRAEHVKVLARDGGLASFDPLRALFIDTETTGLGGASTLVFLIGTIHFAEGRPTLTQFFMPGPGAERPYLEQFLEFLGRFEFLVSYNGRAFDVKAVRDRLVMKRFLDASEALERLPHVDLLHPARRVWQMALVDCRLTTLERDVLGRGRQRDIEGSMIPAAYYSYLHTGRTEQMLDVLAHNEHDLVSLYLLAVRMLRMVASPGEDCYEALDFLEQTPPPHGSARPEEMLGLGTLLSAGGAARRGKIALQRGMASHSTVHRYLARKRLALLHKRGGELEEAALLWQAMIDENALAEPHAHEELAKYREHVERDFEGALRLVEQGIRLARGAARAALEHRRARLERRRSC
ncbi:MAG: hypothetical protein FJX76_17435 [Armatimonadetes bacterium]|nr:hypothetical protein [Armatimonadota bacterium]